MTWNSRVVWSEGMFILPQHFQQAERYLERFVRQRAAPLRSHAWGVAELEINHDALAGGRFELIRCSGLLEDGTPFSLPDDAPLPPSLEVPENTRNCTIRLSLPALRSGAVSIAFDDSGPAAARYRASESAVADILLPASEPVPLQTAQLDLRLRLETDPPTDFVSIGLARVREVRSRMVMLDDSYIPPCLAIRAVAPLRRFVEELDGLLEQRARSLAGRVSDAGTNGAAEYADYLLLLLLNRYSPLIAHLSYDRNIHPEEFYRICLQVAGEAATIFAPDRMAPRYPGYRHDDLEATFGRLQSDLRHALTTGTDPAAIQLQVQQSRPGLWYAPLTDRSLLSSHSFVLAVRSSVPTETLRTTFATQIKIGPAEQIRDLVASASRGIQLSPLPVVPRQLPYQGGKVYFEFQRSGPQWDAMRAAPGFAFHVAGDFPDLEMDFWAIREVGA